MQSQFSTYFTLGLQHITDPKGYDHIVFIIALCAIYRLIEWRKVALLVTAFTIGHSITLALAALKIVTPQYNLVEKLIPITIALTAIFNVLKKDNSNISENTTFSKNLIINYLLALFFGLIHGLGFSNFFRELLGNEAEIVKPLFAFNIGIEAGQLSIVAVILIASFLAFNLFKISQKAWTQFISGAAFGIAVTLLIA
jgi:HupE / UreJ protein